MQKNVVNLLDFNLYFSFEETVTFDKFSVPSIKVRIQNFM